jgi:hypothetical protein
MELWNSLEKKFFEGRSADSFAAHRALYQKAADMMRPEVRAAFDLSSEPEEVRRKYGRGLFGQGCLLARRLVERGVPFVEVPLGVGLGWDTHADNFRQVRRLSQELDTKERGLLASTTILWISEFGRTPVINANAGRDHFPAAWSCVFAGGGIKGGQTYGRTSPDGMTVEENKVAIGAVLATLVRRSACRRTTTTLRPRIGPSSYRKARQSPTCWPDFAVCERFQDWAGASELPCRWMKCSVGFK